jgi:putative two-component system response regulator
MLTRLNSIPGYTQDTDEESIVRVLESTLASRDPYTVIHQQRVTRISTAIARAMGLEAKQVHNLEIAARLHDFGKIWVPIGILLRPGKLSAPEMDIIKTHPAIGADILKPLRFTTDTFLTIIQHHERLDGSGYPFGLSGEDIVLGARILGVADVVEAISSHRPYRPSLGMKRALEEISQQKGILYDPSVVDAFERLYSGNLFGDSFASKDLREAA